MAFALTRAFDGVLLLAEEIVYVHGLVELQSDGSREG